MVRFEKFEILCTQDFEPDLADVRVTSRAARARDVIDLVTEAHV